MNHPSPENSGQQSGRRSVAVWDLPTRLFHWSLVTLVVFLWISSDLSLTWHMRAGEAVIALLLFRMVWGGIGSSRSRFADFIASPASARRHFAEIWATVKGRATPHTPSWGHTPLGGWMIMALLGLLIVQAGTGLFTTERHSGLAGPLAHLAPAWLGGVLTLIHKAWFNLLLVAVGVHILAALFYLVVQHENLIWTMISGKKVVPADTEVPDNRLVSPWLALLALLVAVGVVYALVRL
jgi:cytochrome b